MTIAELGDIFLKMSGAHIVILTIDSALQERPKTLNGVCVSVATNIFFLAVNNNLMVFELFYQILVPAELVTHDDRVAGNVLADDRFKSFSVGTLDAFRNYLSASFNHAKDGCFISLHISSSPAVSLSANESLVDLNDTLEKIAVLVHCLANPHSHVPSRVFIHSNIARELTGANSLLCIEHERDSNEPLLEIDFRFMKDRSNRNAERSIACVTVMAILAFHRAGFCRLTVGAFGRAVPANSFKVFNAEILGGEPLVYIDDIHVLSCGLMAESLYHKMGLFSVNVKRNLLPLSGIFLL